MASSQSTSHYQRAHSTSQTGRRQHRSCDQCRKGKRACDLMIAKDGSSNKGRNGLSCSNCTKTNKRCTSEWLRAMHGIQTGRRKDTGKMNSVAMRSEIPSGVLAPDCIDGIHKFQEPKDSTSLDFYGDACKGPSICPEVPVVSYGHFGSSVPCQQSKGTTDRNQEADLLQSIEAGNFEKDFQFGGDPTTMDIPTYAASTCVNTFSASTLQSIRSPAGLFGNPVLYSSVTDASSSQKALSDSDLLSDPSPTSLQQRLIDSTTHSFLTGGLIRIYHDSLENALSCWLTERTCPYSLTSKAPSSTPQETMSTEWGPNWSNRICARVCRLDRVSSRLTSQPLTKAQDQAASRALHTSIMSFATQWTQSSQRSTSNFSSFMVSDNDFDISSSGTPNGTESSYNTTRSPFLDRNEPPLHAEFDRSIQETTWHQARKALQESANIDSFRVIFAHIIFSLTQRPLDMELEMQNMKTRRRRRSSSQSTFPAEIQNDTSELDQIFEVEGPPIYLESALRQIHSYRCRLERIERERSTEIKKMNHMTSLPIRTDPLTEADRETFNLLFWLGIMFDTLSAAMNQRPLVVSDEDSDILERRSLETVTRPATDPERNFSSSKSYPACDTVMLDSKGPLLWGKLFLKEKNTTQTQAKARWPCSYEEAATTLCDAAPVKVLLFRKVTHLQTLLSRRCRMQDLDEAINDAQRVYKHWNQEFGQFILDCISTHHSLPPRIQSWYVILAGHWHLGALLLADIIEIIDEGKLGSATQRNCRYSSGIVTKLRRQNTHALSDLAKCSSPHEDASFPNCPEFHFALNKGALMTEPWTVVLIRAFGKAGSLLLDSMTSANSNDSDSARIRCGYCLQALWHLGKKSDMAFLAATALSEALKEKTSAPDIACSSPGTIPDVWPDIDPYACDDNESHQWMEREPFDLDPSFWTLE